MATNPFSEVKGINVETKTLGIKKVIVIIQHEDMKVVYNFVDSKQVDMPFVFVKFEVFRNGSEENCSKQFRENAPTIIYNFVSWLLKEYSMRNFKSFTFSEPDDYNYKYELFNNKLNLISYGYSNK